MQNHSSAATIAVIVLKASRISNIDDNERIKKECIYAIEEKHNNRINEKYHNRMEEKHEDRVKDKCKDNFELKLESSSLDDNINAKRMLNSMLISLFKKLQQYH